MNTGIDEEKRPIPPIKRSVWILLKRYALEKTKATGRQITLSEVIEEALLNLTSVEIDKKKN